MFYSGTERGIPLDTQIRIQSAKGNRTFQGYISFDDLATLLSSSNCVGVRFYNSQDDNGKPRIIAVGVEAEGGEIAMVDGESGYFLSGDFENNDTVSSRIADRSDAKNLVIALSAVNADSRFSSYLSKAVIENLIGNQTNDVQGILLFMIPLFAGSNSPFTHLAQPVAVNNGAASVFVQKAVVSALPCPPNCAPEKPKPIILAGPKGVGNAAGGSGGVLVEGEYI